MGLFTEAQQGEERAWAPATPFPASKSCISGFWTPALTFYSWSRMPQEESLLFGDANFSLKPGEDTA